MTISEYIPYRLPCPCRPTTLYAMHIGTLKSKLNERIEEEHCSPSAPVATYRARFPQQSATSAVQEWLVQVLTAICIKVLNGGLKPIQNFKEEN